MLTMFELYQELEEESERLNVLLLTLRKFPAEKRFELIKRHFISSISKRNVSYGGT